jgi:two-component system chemotaxis response regulator CheB
MMPLIVIGASVGGLDALADVLGEISPDIPAPILAVIHIGATDAQLPRFFHNRSPLPVRYAFDGEPLSPGIVLLAPPDRHLIVVDGHLHLGHGPKENHTRPAIDPLFRSAAESAGPLVIGVILTGYLTDGTAGLWEVKRRGGVTVVQNPEEAAAPSMPLSAVQHVGADHCLGLKGIGRLLNQLAADAVRKAPQQLHAHGEIEMVYTADHPIALTCPDCGGSVRKVTKGTYTQFQCHIGHTFGVPEMAKEQFDVLESTLGQSLRLLNERKELCRDQANEARGANREQEAMLWDAAGEESELRFNQLAKMMEGEWQRPELTAIDGRGRDKTIAAKT